MIKITRRLVENHYYSTLNKQKIWKEYRKFYEICEKCIPFDLINTKLDIKN